MQSIIIVQMKSYKKTKIDKIKEKQKLMSYLLSLFFHEFFLETMFYCELFLLLDLILSGFGIQGIYYLFHALHNIVIGYKTYSNVYHSFHMVEYPQMIEPGVFPLLYGLHIYHLLKYIRFISFDEIAHHFLCLFVAIPISCTFKNRNLLGFSLFASTGWSTVFHYFSLFLYKNHIVSKRKTLQYNFVTNTFLRSPLILFNSAFLIQYMVQYENITKLDIFLSMFLFSILVTNGLYFQYKVTEKYFQSIMVHRENV